MVRKLITAKGELERGRNVEISTSEKTKVPLERKEMQIVEGRPQRGALAEGVGKEWRELGWPAQREWAALGDNGQRGGKRPS